MDTQTFERTANVLISTVDTRQGQSRNSISIPIPANNDINQNYCASKQDLGDMNADGLVNISFDVKGEKGETLDDISTYSTFNGQNANNDWDIAEQGRCAAASNTVVGEGIFMSARDENNNYYYNTCNKIYNVDDDDGVTITFIPTEYTPDEPEEPGICEDVEAWVDYDQPTSVGLYQKGDRVTHDGGLYESLVNNLHTIEPGTSGEYWDYIGPCS